MSFNETSVTRVGLDKDTSASPIAANYTMGVVLRERERLARIFATNGMGAIASLIRDKSQDDKVFKNKGPEVGLNGTAEPVRQR